MNSFVSSKVGFWSHYVELLSNIADDQPQLAFIALTRSLQQKWLYLQRVTPNCSELFADIEHQLMNRFLPSLFGHGCTPHEHVLYFLPIRMGGLNVRNPVTSSDYAYSASRSAVHLLVRSIIEQQLFCPIDHCFHIQHSKLEHSSLMKSINNDISDTVIKQFNKYHRAILRSKKYSFLLAECPPNTEESL